MAANDARKKVIKYVVLSVGAVSTLYLVRKLAAAETKSPLAPHPDRERSRSLIEKLNPVVQPMAWRLLDDAWAEGIPLVVTQSLRTMAEQQALYDQGRTKPGAIVTNALPGSSWHNFALAFDVAVLDGRVPTWPNNPDLWRRIGTIGKAAGLAWGGDFKSIIDQPHFEFHPGMTLADARAGKRPSGPPVA